MKLTDEEIAKECINQAGNAIGNQFQSDDIKQSRRLALEYYQGQPRGDEIDGRSHTQSLDVADMVHAILSQAMPTFNSGDLIQFEPQNEQDEEQARVESRHVNYLINEKSNGYTLWETLLKDCLLSKNSTAKVMVDVKQDIERERYKDLTPEQMFMILQPTKKNQEIDVTKIDKEKGILNLKRITTNRKLIVAPVAPENFGVAESHEDVYLDDCIYCFERYQVTRSELIEEGYDKDLVNDLQTYGGNFDELSLTRDQDRTKRNNYQSQEKSMQLIEVYEHIIRIDRDGDGVAELLKVKTASNRLLKKKGKGDIEEIECVPYANGIVILMSHRFYGMSIFDLLKHVQDQKTHFLRQWADNALAGNHNKFKYINGQVNMDELNTGRPNAGIGVESLQSLEFMPVADIGPSCQLALDYYDKIRTDRTGSALDLQANQVAMPSNVGDQGVNTLIANLEKVSALMIRNFCETQVQSVYKIVHKYLRLYFPEELSAKMGGQWSTTNPQQWLERDQLTITVPPTESEKIKQAIAIEKSVTLAMNEQAQGKNNITTSDANIYQMKLDLMRLRGIDNPEKYLVNPDSPQAKQTAHMMAQMQKQERDQQKAEQSRLQQALLETQIAEIRRNWESDIKDRELDHKKHIDDLKLKYAELAQKYYDTDKDAEVQEAKIIGDSTTKLEMKSLDGTDDRREDTRKVNGSGEAD